MNRSNIRLLKGAALGLVLAFMAALTAFAISCSPGLGTSLDLSGPTLEITSHQNIQYVGLDLVLSGTCTDNEKVTRVVVQNMTTGETYPDATITGETWSISLNLTDGEKTLRVTAYDKNSNASVSSVKQITLLVDAKKPFMKSLEILRMPGITTSLKERSILEALVADDSANMDSFQNGTFTIRGVAGDNYSLNSVVLKLYDEKNELVLTKEMPAGSNMTAPTFTITHADLVGANSAYASGRHYLYATITNTDIGGNSDTQPFLWFCWYPEADFARIKQSMTNDDLLVIPKDTAIPVEYFDDDALSEVYVKMITPDAWNAISGTGDDAKLQTLITDSSARSSVLGINVLSQSQRNWEYTLPATWGIGEYALVTLVKDVKVDGSVSVWSSRKIQVQVTDKDSPLIVIKNPAENTFPTLSGGSTFNLFGYTLDNGNVVDLKIAWVPYGISDGADANITKAQQLLEASKLAAGSEASDSSGIKIWSVSLDSAVSIPLNGKPYQKRTFTVPMNVFTTFMYNGAIENKLKLFVIMTLDNDGNRVYQNFRLQGDTMAPVITVAEPASEMQVKSLAEDLVLKFSASKANGLALDAESYKLVDITDPQHPAELTLLIDGLSHAVTIPATTLATYGEGRRTYQFVVKDMLGNESKEQRTVILSNLPVLKHITSGVMDKTYKSGDVITVQAVFSKPVKVTGSPRLGLLYFDGDGIVKYASYSQGSGTDTLVFTYLVPDGAVSSDLCSADTPIDLNGSTITTTEGTGGNAFLATFNPATDVAKYLQTAKDIVLEGTIPSITDIVITGGNVVGAKQYFKAGDVMTIKLTASELLSVSGSPKLKLDNGIEGTFYKTNGADILFTHSFKQETPENVSTVTWTPASALGVADLAVITDVAGNAVRSVSGTLAGNAVIDMTLPVEPTITGVGSGTQTTNQTITLDGIEAGATGQYSIDGGLSWTTYDDAHKKTLTSGSYKVKAVQTDIAGNVSTSNNAVTGYIRLFPDLLATSCESPNGNYVLGSKLTFKLAFSAPVNATIGCGAKITLSGSGYTDDVVLSKTSAGETVLYFEYTVPSNKSMYPVAVSAIDLTGVTDMYANKATDKYSVGSAPPLMVGKTVNVDSIDPVFSETLSVPAKDGRSSAVVATGVDTGKTVSIELRFSENVYPESGLITIQRSGDWIIPIVMTEKEFSDLYYTTGFTDTDRNNLINNVNGIPITDPTTSRCLGPYQKTTHGIVLKGGKWVPDTATKYVLEYNLDPKEASVYAADDIMKEHPLNTIGKIRSLMKTAKYGMQSIDVISSYVVPSGNSIIVTFPTPLVKGREWDVSIPAGAFRDAAGNKTAAISYSFWSNGVETPVIRVNRNSYGEIPSTGVPSPTTIDSTTGTVKVRIDCETPGTDVVIRYGIKEMGHKDTLSMAGNLDTAIVPDAVESPSTNAEDITKMTDKGVYSAPFSVGTTFTTTEAWAEKFYIGATATKPSFTEVSGTPTTGYEAAYKTLIVHYNPDHNNVNHVIQGSTVRGGIPTVSGFPLRDADSDRRYSKYCYKDGTTYYWLSWEIVSEFYTQGKYNYPGGDYQNGYDLIQPGCATGTKNRAFYN